MSNTNNNIFTFDEVSQTNINWFTKSIGVFIGHTNIGIIAIDSKNKKNSKDIFLIDSGTNSDNAKTVYESLKKEFSSFEIKSIINTHSHADHCGGNAEFVRLSKCKIYATQMEKSSIECPEIQSSIAFGGFPLPEYMSTYYLAEPSKVDVTIKSNHIFKLNNNITLQCIPLPGHYFEMIGVLCTQTDEDTKKSTSVFFASDGIFTREMLSKYWVPFLFDIKKFKESLEVIKSTKANFYVPGHGEIYTEVDALYELNMISCLQNEDAIINCVKQNPATFEEILKYIADLNNIPIRLSQYMLVGSTVRSYITYLYKEKKITYSFKQNKMYWKLKS